jgi:hypothetical protein
LSEAHKKKALPKSQKKKKRKKSRGKEKGLFITELDVVMWISCTIRGGASLEQIGPWPPLLISK